MESINWTELNWTENRWDTFTAATWSQHSLLLSMRAANFTEWTRLARGSL